MALVNQDGKVLVKNGKLASGSACCDTVVNVNYYACTGSNGCEARFGPLPDFTTYETLEACQQQCAYLGVICDDWDYYEQTYYECRGPYYGMPGSEMGPATCEDCNPECCPVVITGTCFGSGANASIVADDESGTITEILLTRPGGGYAKFGRVQPTLVVSGASASFLLSPRTGQFPCELPYWTIDYIFIPPDSALRLFYKEGSHRIYPGGPGVIWTEAAHVIMHVETIAPTLLNPLVITASVRGGSGSGAVLTPILTEFISEDEGDPRFEIPSTVGERFWTISSIEITNPGSGYTPFDPSTLEGDFFQDTYQYENGPWPSSGVQYGANFYPFFGWVESVDENGGITAVTIYEPPPPTPPVRSQTLAPLTRYGGVFYDRVITGVTVLCGGRYYAEDPSVPPYVSPVTVSISCRSGVTGTNAVIEAVVDDDTASETFGEIAELVIENGGIGYANSCENEFP